MKTSTQLTVGAIYSREDLRSQFDIVDATINTGVFRPKGHDSIWLFVTENKTSDRTQYADRLEADSLFWQGQMSGRSDATIIQHAAHGLELLLFYRRKKYEYPKAGFRFAGVFAYVSHFGRHPTSFLLRRDGQKTAIRNSQQSEYPLKALSEVQQEVRSLYLVPSHSLNDVIVWLAENDRVSAADLRARLLPLDLLPAALVDELNERALALTGDMAIEEIGEEMLIDRAILSELITYSV